MTLLRFFRSTPRNGHLTEGTEMSRILRKGPHDRPAGLREAHSYGRSLDGRW